MATFTGYYCHVGWLQIAHEHARGLYRTAVAKALECPVERVLVMPATYGETKAAVRAQVGAAVKSNLWFDGEFAGSVETLMMLDDDCDLCIATTIQEPTDGVA